MNIDIYEDGYDEVIINQSVLKRKQFENVFYSSLYAFDFKNHKNFSIEDSLPATDLASTPWIGDLDNNKKFDIVYTTVKYDNAAFDLQKPVGLFIRKYSTNIKIKRASSWCVYGKLLQRKIRVTKNKKRLLIGSCSRFH